MPQKPRKPSNVVDIQPARERRRRPQTPPRTSSRSGGAGAALRGLGLTEEQVAAEVQRLAELYDADRPAVSFSRWAADRGDGAVVDQFKALLRAAGQVDVIAALDATPPAPEKSPEEKIAELDAPLEGGPWALDAGGQWVTVPEGLPGEYIQADGRSLYVPAEHPSTHVKENQYGAGEAHRKRWTDQKFRAANRAMLGPRPFYDLFFNVAPRGGWGGGQGFGRAFEGTPDDYEYEGGNLYPDLQGGALAQSLADWYGKNNFDARFGYDRGLTLNWLRVYTGSDGYRHYKPWSSSEAQEFGERWHMASPGYVGTQGETSAFGAGMMARQAERQSGQPEGDFSVHWAWPIGPLSQFEPSSSSRRRKNLKKAAAVAAIVVGAVFLGPVIAGAIKGAAGGIAAKAGAAASKIIPKIVSTANAVTTVKAIKDGKVPPPPVELNGSRFVDYAAAIGTNLVQREVQEQGRELEAAERAALEEQMRQQVAYLQAQARGQLPAGAVPQYALPGARPAVAAGAAAGDSSKWLAVGALALVLGLSLSR